MSKKKSGIDIDMLMIQCKAFLLMELAICSSIPLNCRIIALLLKLISSKLVGL